MTLRSIKLRLLPLCLTRGFPYTLPPPPPKPPGHHPRLARGAAYSPPPHPLATWPRDVRLLRRGASSENQQVVFRGSLGGSKHLAVVKLALVASLRIARQAQAVPHPSTSRTSPDWVSSYRLAEPLPPLRRASAYVWVQGATKPRSG